MGGSLWLNNGNPSIYEITDNKINIISNPLIIENLPEEFNNIQKISYSDFRKIILEKIIKWKIYLYFMARLAILMKYYLGFYYSFL